MYTERPTLMMMALGFAAGLPFLLIFDTLSAWLRDEGLTLEVIGFFSLATLVYSFKFLWAPLIDRMRVPWLTTWLGHRRSWMLTDVFYYEDEHISILVDGTLPSASRDAATGWPCFR